MKVKIHLRGRFKQFHKHGFHQHESAQFLGNSTLFIVLARRSELRLALSLHYKQIWEQLLYNRRVKCSYKESLKCSSKPGMQAYVLFMFCILLQICSSKTIININRLKCVLKRIWIFCEKQKHILGSWTNCQQTRATRTWTWLALSQCSFELEQVKPWMYLWIWHCLKNVARPDDGVCHRGNAGLASTMQFNNNIPDEEEALISNPSTKRQSDRNKGRGTMWH